MIETKFCPDCSDFLPIDKFHNCRGRISTYCKLHVSLRNKKSAAKMRALRPKKEQLRWPENGSWPLLTECKTKAKCRDCKRPWTLARFNKSKKSRTDGSAKPLPYCCYCQSEKRIKREMIKSHIAREEARRIA